jgi:VCBS repeat-containing protein
MDSTNITRVNNQKVVRDNRGFSTLEILIAFAIVILCIGAVILIVFGNQSVAVDSQINNEAISKAQKMLEDARATSRFDFNLVNPSNSTETSGALTFIKKLDVTQIDLFTKQAISTVSWISGGRTLSVFFTTLFTNLDSVTGGGTCSSILSNPTGWKTPTYYTFPSVTFAGPNANGFEISDLDVFNKKLYVVASDTPVPNPQSFFIVSLPDDPSQNPTVLGSVDNNGSSQTGLSAVRVSGNYAYVANAYAGSASNCVQNSNCAQLQVIDISNPSSPSVVKNLKIPTVTSGGKLSAGTSIYYKNGYVYLGLAKATTGNEFNIIDVGGGGGGASPTNPILKGGYPIGNGVNSITIKGNYAYVVSPNNENLTIIDISNKNNPTPPRAGGFTPIDLPEANGVGSNHGKTISVIGNTAYLGRTYGPKEFYALDIANPGSLSVVGAPLNIGSGNQTSINGLLIRDFLAFFITPSQFQVWNISDINNIQPWTLDGTTNSFLNMSILGGSGVATNCEGDRIYVAVSSSQGNNKDILGVIVPGTPSVYNLSNSGDITVTQGSSGSNTITRTIVSGTPSGETLTVSGLPNGASVNSFTNNPCAANCSGTLTINTTFPTTPAGTYPIIVSSPSGLTTTFNLIVNAAFTYSLNASPATKNLNQGSSYSELVTITKNTGAAQAVTLSLSSNFQNNVTVTPAPISASCTPNPTCNVVYTINAAANAQKATRTITVTGTSPATTASFTLTIQ